MVQMNGQMALGRSGLSVSPVGFGMWRMGGDDLDAALATVDAALAAGFMELSRLAVPIRKLKSTPVAADAR